MEYVDGMSLYQSYFVPIGSDPEGMMTGKQVQEIMAIVDGCKDYGCVNVNAANQYLINVLTTNNNGERISASDLIEGIQSKLEIGSAGVAQAGQLANGAQLLLELNAAVNGNPTGTAASAFLKKKAEQIEQLQEKLESITNGVSIVQNSMTVIAGLKSDSSAIDQINGLAAILNLGQIFTDIPVLQGILGQYADAVKAAGNGLNAINEHYIETDIANFSAVPCDDKSNFSPSNQDTKVFWQGLTTALTSK